MFDPFGRRRIAQLQDANTKLAQRVTRLEGCKETLSELNERRTADLNQAHVHLSNGSTVHRAVRMTLIEQLALGVVDGLAGGWAYKVADELAARAGVDLRPAIKSRINEMTSETRLPDAPSTGGGKATAVPLSEAPLTQGDASSEQPEATAAQPTGVHR